MRCKHCDRHCAKGKRGLCQACYYKKPGVRALYASERDTGASKPRCLHCKIRSGGQRSGRRGLCSTCHGDLTIRILYPSTQATLPMIGVARKGKKLGRPDPNPTHHLPGTEAKVQVLIARAKAGYSLFHPDDAMLESVVDVPLLAMLAG